MRIEQIRKCHLRAAFQRLTAAALAVALWPYLIDFLATLIEYLSGTDSFDDADEFWSSVWFFRFFGACSILLAWIVRSAINTLHIKHVKLLSYIAIYCLFVALFYKDEKYSDYESVISALHGGLLPLSMIILCDLLYGMLATALSRLRSE